MNREAQISRREGLISAVLDIRKLVHRCVELETELQTQKRLNSEQETIMARLREGDDRRDALIAFGEQELQRRKEDILINLRAIVHHTGDRKRLHSMERLLASDSLLPEEVKRWHSQISDEFQLLYPTRSLSQPTLSGERAGSETVDWSAYRITKK